MDKGCGSGSGIFPDPDPGDPKRPDPIYTVNHSIYIVHVVSSIIHAVHNVYVSRCQCHVHP